MSAPPQSPVRLQIVEEHIAVVTLDRPDVHNAINTAMAEQIEGLVDRIETDPRIRVAILAATGRSFCAGADLREVAVDGAPGLMRPGSGFGGFVHARRTKPWIAAVQGLALGGGCEIAFSCDMIVASHAATFGLPEVRRGLMPGGAGAYRIARILPRAVGLEMITTGGSIDASRAYALGMVNRLVEVDMVVETAISIAREVAASAPVAVRASLILSRSAYDIDEDRLRALEASCITVVMASVDAAEGVRAFVGKRAAYWRD